MDAGPEIKVRQKTKTKEIALEKPSATTASFAFGEFVRWEMIQSLFLFYSYFFFYTRMRRRLSDLKLVSSYQPEIFCAFHCQEFYSDPALSRKKKECRRSFDAETASSCMVIPSFLVIFCVTDTSTFYQVAIWFPLDSADPPLKWIPGPSPDRPLEVSFTRVHEGARDSRLSSLRFITTEI